MALVIPGYSSSHEYTDVSIGDNTSTNTGECLFSIQIPSGPGAEIGLFALSGVGQGNFIQGRRSSGGDVQARFGFSVSGTSGYQTLGSTDTRLNMSFRWNDTTKIITYQVNGVESTFAYPDPTDNFGQAAQLSLLFKSTNDITAPVTDSAVEVYNFAILINDTFTDTDRTNYATGATIASLSKTPETGWEFDGTGYPATINSTIGTANTLTHGDITVGFTDSGSAYAPFLTSAGSVPSITSVSSAVGSNIVGLNTSLTITGTNLTGTTSARVNTQALTNVVVVNDTTVTADAPLGVAADIGASCSVYATNGTGESLAFVATVGIETTYSSVDLISAYGDLPEDSVFFGETAYSSLAVGDVWVYDNLSSTLTYDGNLLATFDPAITVNTDGDGWFLDASDSYNGDLAITTVTHQAPPSNIPVMGADVTPNHPENSAYSDTFAVTNSAPSVVYTLSGTDSSDFTINSSTGLVSLIGTPDFETKNIYNITVTATNSFGNDSQNITLNITNIIEVVITDGGVGNFIFPKGDAGLPRTDIQVTQWADTFTNSTSNTISSLPTTLTVLGSPYAVTFSANDALDVVSSISVTEQAQFAPTDINLNSTSVNINAGLNAIVGSLSSTDLNINDTHTYSLVAGIGDTNNASFNILGTNLRCNDPLTLGQGVYSIRIQTSDGTDTFQKVFSISVVTITVAEYLNNNGLWSAYLDSQGFSIGSIDSRRRAWLKQRLSLSEEPSISNDGLLLQFLAFEGITGQGLHSRLKSWYETELGQNYPDNSLRMVESTWLRSQL